MRADRYEGTSFARPVDGANRPAGTGGSPCGSSMAVRQAIHTTLVMSTPLAITCKGFGNPQMVLFAGFDSLRRW